MVYPLGMPLGHAQGYTTTHHPTPAPLITPHTVSRLRGTGLWAQNGEACAGQYAGSGKQGSRVQGSGSRVQEAGKQGAGYRKQEAGN